MVASGAVATVVTIIIQCFGLFVTNYSALGTYILFKNVYAYVVRKLVKETKN